MICDTYTATIEIAGNFDHIRQVCRQYCYDKGECVSLVAAEYPYKGGLTPMMRELMAQRSEAGLS